MDLSKILSRFQIKGVTATGGTSNEADYLVKLNENGELPNTVIPAFALISVTTVADQAARLALAGSVEVGDIAIQTDNNRTYVLATGTGSVNGDWASIAVTDDPTAAEISFTPAGSIAATDTQAAIEELDGDITSVDGDLSTHISDDTVHLTSAQNTLLDGLNPTLTATELNYVDGVTSSIQTQIDSKADDSDLTTHIADETKHLTSAQNTLLDGLNGTLTATELNYVDGVTSSIQTQLDSKAAATDLTTHIADETKHLTSAQNTLLDGVVASALELNFSVGVSSAIQTQLNNRAEKYLAIQGTSGSYTLVLTDAGRLVNLDSASAAVLTVPPNSSVAFPLGTQILLTQINTGEFVITPDTGVTINSHESLTTTAGQWAVVSLIKTGTDTWLLTGNLA